MSKRLSILLVSMTMLCLTLAACGNGDGGPVAVEELFQRVVGAEYCQPSGC